MTKGIFRFIAKFLSQKGIYISKSLTFRKTRQTVAINLDYVRYSTLGLCFEEIISKNIKGNIAELGVYKGDFAKRLNNLFSDRQLYLFDTFEGFDQKDIKKEKDNDFSKANQDFSDTSLNIVMQKMSYPEKCIVRKGFFPDTAKDISDSFCFVSIDADLYEPIYHGLNFFYPKLEKGGYIFVHDYNNDEYKGAKEAVLRFSTENSISFLPIPDSGGTAIFTK